VGGWDAQTGKRLWKLIPPIRGDFNVPTVVPVQGQLLVTSENNGTRLYRFHGDGTLDPDPVAINTELAPDAHTPVVCADRVFGIWNALYALDLKDNLRTIGRIEDDAFANYGSLIASDERLLALSGQSELLLLNGSTDLPAIISRLQLGDGSQRTLSHPAIVGSSLYVRFGRTLARLNLQ
jgi:hypothetical protein